MGTQNSRTDIPPRAGGGGARERQGILDPQSGRRPAADPPGRALSRIRDPRRLSERSGAALTAFSSWTHNDHRVHDEWRPITETRGERFSAGTQWQAKKN